MSQKIISEPRKPIEWTDDDEIPHEATDEDHDETTDPRGLYRYFVWLCHSKKLTGMLQFAVSIKHTC